ncbi:Elongator subunit elp2 [Actinomortierella ambigua]|nr:Elongator subunit elp2 [Actinomortierella ambigua]
MDSAKRGVRATLRGHSNRVNCVSFLQRGQELGQTNVAILSGSSDKTARVWKKNQSGDYVCSAVIEGHTGSVITLGVLKARSITTDTDLIATGSADGSIKIWERKELDADKDEVTCIQTIQVGNKYPQSIAISYLPNTTSPIMAVGSTDNRINIYVRKDGQFVKSLSLQGHENWVRSLDFASFTKVEGVNISPEKAGSSHHHTLQDGDLLLASGSQDKYIRLWRFSPVDTTSSEANVSKDPSEGALTQEMLQNFEDMYGGIKKNVVAECRSTAHILEDPTSNQKFSAMFEALLLGHDDWVYTIQWQPAKLLDGQYHQPMALLSASTDKSMMIWRPDEETGVWVNSTRVGEVGGGVTGFYGGLFGPDGDWIMAYGYNGAFHIWRNEGNEIADRWVPQVPASGHFSSVQDLTWDPSSEYLVSVSLDQTARLLAPWKHQDSKTKETIQTWHEIARPQIHGYDIQCVAFSDKWTFVSGSDEKVLRVFDAPRTFVHSLSTLTGNPEHLADEESRPVGANLPALGLSNKAVFEGDIAQLVEAQETEEYLNRQSFVSTGATPTSLTEAMNQPPYEEHLLQHTLWPEVEKLFGHGYELMCVDASHDGKWIASACRAHTPDQAVVRIYDAKSWKQTRQPLVSHTLTVTKVLFSHNDKYLLSISRDRLWSLYERVEGQEETNPYKLVASNKAHARILWDCSWSSDDSMFATASRDKTVKIWVKKDPSWAAVATLKLPEAVTAVAFAPMVETEDEGNQSRLHLLAAGLEDGRMFVFSSEAGAPETWTPVCEVPRGLAHTGTINSLAWRTVKGEARRMQLASAGVDHSVRLFDVCL